MPPKFSCHALYKKYAPAASAAITAITGKNAVPRPPTIVMSVPIIETTGPAAATTPTKAIIQFCVSGLAFENFSISGVMTPRKRVSTGINATPIISFMSSSLFLNCSNLPAVVSPAARASPPNSTSSSLRITP